MGIHEGQNSQTQQPVAYAARLAAALNCKAGVASNVSDPTCGRLAALNYSGQIVPGIVVRSGIGTYACEVAIGTDICVCTVMSPVLSELSGAVQSSLPVEGSCVLVFRVMSGRDKPSGSGYILGVLPNDLTGPACTRSGTLRRVTDSESLEGGASLLTETGPATIESDSDYLRAADNGGGRHRDIIPGEYSILTRSGGGLHVGAVSTSIRGSALSSVRCSAIDDQVRVVSDHFQHISAAGVSEIYNDGGFITLETSISVYQPERYGVADWDDEPFEEDDKPDLTTLDTDGRCGISPKKRTQVSKPRIRNFTGYMGDVVNFFVSKPGDNSVSSMETAGSDLPDQGLLHAHVDSSGVATLRSAAGIMLERYDRIPVPKRVKYPWDPYGDRPEDGEMDVESRDGFKLDSDYPGTNGLVLADMAAWWNHLAYMHFRQFENDFDVPKQTDTSRCSCPDEEYDKLGNGKNDILEYDRRHSYVSLTPDGGIVLRDAWGSEIVMQGGNITISAANNIEIRPGKTAVVMAGDDAIIKGYNSVDVTATNKDVRVKAEKNLHMMSSSGGVLIQSKASGNTVKYKDMLGEDVISSGVLIKADSSTVACMGDRAHIGGRSLVSVESLRDDSPAGDIVMVGKTVSTVAEDSVVSSVGPDGNAGIIISQSSTVVAGRGTVVTGDKSVISEANGSAYVGFSVDVEPMYPSASKVFRGLYSKFAVSQKWLAPYRPSEYDTFTFKFRTSEQYGTDVPNHYPVSSARSFCMVQPAWTLLTSGRPWMAGVSYKTWDEHDDCNDDAEYPWPGRDAYTTDGTYITYTEHNITDDGLEDVVCPGKSDEAGQSDSSSADDVDDAGCKPKLTLGTFSEYHIRS